MEKETLEFLLDEVTVSVVDDYHNEVNGNKLEGLLGWYYFSDLDGVTAYFSTEREALSHRLAYINRRLNPLQV